MIWRNPEHNVLDDLPSELDSVAWNVLRSVQAKVHECQQDKCQVEIVQGFEHEYVIELLRWLMYVDGPPGAPRSRVTSLLDVGAGWGTTMRVGMELGIDVLGIDSLVLPCPDYRIEDCNIFDLSRLTSMDLGKRDLVVCTEVLEHLSFDPTMAFREILRMTEASWVFISVPHGRYAEYWPMGRIRYTEMPKWNPSVVDPVHQYVHRKPWEMDELGQFLGQFGFEVVGYRQTAERNIVLARRIPHAIRPVSGFARVSGCLDYVGGRLIPSDWWSRRYEYPWAAQFCRPGMSVLDVGCGVVHPFKEVIADLCGRAYGMDIDWGILGVRYPNLEVIHHDATEPWTMFGDGMLDGVFCISTFEHIFPTQRALTILSEARRVVKPDGFVAVTFDVPDVSVRWFERAIATCGLEYLGVVEREEPVDVLVQSQVIPTWPPHPRPGPQGPERRRTTFAAILRPSP